MKSRNQKVLYLFLLVLMLFHFSVAAFASEEAEFKLTIVHTNDMHGYPEAVPYAKGLVDGLKAQRENVLLIDAGDAFASTVFSNYTDAANMATIMNMAGYDLFTVGNHEQMMSLEAYGKAASLTAFPHLGANMNEAFKTAGDVKDYVVKEVSGVKIAFIGLSSGGYTDRNASEAVAAAEEARTAAAAEGATVFIGVFHLGITDSDLTKRSTYIAENCGWLTAIIDGHCHTSYAQTVNGVYMVETGGYSNNIGVMELSFKAGKVTAISPDCIVIKGNEQNCGIVPDPEIIAYIAEAEKKLAEFSETVGTVPVDLDGERTTVRAKEAVIGNIAADAMREYTGAEIAFVPGVFLRGSVRAGDMTRGTLQALFLRPETEVLYFELTGTEIMAIMEKSLENVPEVSGEFRQISGIRVRYDETKAAGSRIVSIITDDGMPLEAERIYRVAGTTFDKNKLYGENEEAQELALKQDPVSLNQMFIDYINAGKVGSWEIDYRLVSVN